MFTTRRILGKRGRTTIPYEFRQILNLRPTDVISFSINDDKNCVIITKEKICDECNNMSRDEKVSAIAMLSSTLLVKDGDADAA